eukprot:3795020-Amphidinium_carterae.1
MEAFSMSLRYPYQTFRINGKDSHFVLEDSVANDTLPCSTSPTNNGRNLDTMGPAIVSTNLLRRGPK